MWKRYRRQATLLILMMLSALLYWAERNTGPATPAATAAARHETPEWITYNADIWLAASNAPKNSHYLHVQGASHWPRQKRTELSLPTGWIIRPDQLLYWQGKQGHLRPDTLGLDTDVRLALFRPEQPVLYLLTEHLRYNVAEKLVSTPEDVKIKQGNLLLTGKILQYWLETQHLRINQEVLAHYENPSHS